MTTATITELLAEYDRALTYTDELWSDLTPEQVRWRASDDASAIGWHLGHQAAVAHFMVRNLTAAEPPIDARLDRLMDSATPEVDRGDLPGIAELRAYRDTVAARVRFRIGNIAAGSVSAPAQLGVIAQTLLVAVVNHEYQHSQWIGEIRIGVHGLDLPDAPVSERLSVIEGYFVLGEPNY